MINYLCVGLGVFLTVYAVNLASPESDLGFFEGIAAFLLTIFLWPLTLIVNGRNALKVRQRKEGLDKMFNELLSKAEALESTTEGSKVPTAQDNEENQS